MTSVGMGLGGGGKQTDPQSQSPQGAWQGWWGVARGHALALTLRGRARVVGAPVSCPGKQPN